MGRACPGRLAHHARHAGHAFKEGGGEGMEEGDGDERGRGGMEEGDGDGSGEKGGGESSSKTLLVPLPVRPSAGA